MAVFELVIGLLLAGAVLTAWANRGGVPYPSLLALAGAAAAFLPGAPMLELEPDLVLALFVAPVLLDAGYDASPRDLKDNWVPVTGLVVFAVGSTILAVALVARWMMPEMPWAAAVALGAIVAPPDASAATAVLRRLRPPHRVLVILEGESLLNDASALLVYRGAVVAAASGQAPGWEVAPWMLAVCLGSIALGYGLARLYPVLTAPLRRDVSLSIVMQFIGTFGVWLAAERLGLSAIITVVAYAMTVARQAPLRSGARHRIASYAVWDVVVFVLNLLAFVLVGLQLNAILPRLDGQLWQAGLVAGAVVLATLLVRIAWVMGYNTVVRWKNRRWGVRARPREMSVPTWQGGVLIAWCGMRGVVTLAAALALPEGFPYRDQILFCAVCVVLATLVLQGLTLAPLLRWLGLHEDDAVAKEAGLARAALAAVALRELAGAPPSAEVSMLRVEYAARLRGRPEQGDALAEAQRGLVQAQRLALMALRREGAIGDDAFHVLEEELDLLELSADSRVRPVAVG